MLAAPFPPSQFEYEGNGKNFRPCLDSSLDCPLSYRTWLNHYSDWAIGENIITFNTNYFVAKRKERANINSSTRRINTPTVSDPWTAGWRSSVWRRGWLPWHLLFTHHAAAYPTESASSHRTLAYKRRQVTGALQIISGQMCIYCRLVI